MKKVLHILASNKFSGAENVVCTLIDNFKGEIDMAYCSPDGLIKETLKSRKIKFYPLKKLSFLELKKVLKEYAPDIIHCHDYKASVLAAAVGFKGKIISHLHCNPPFAKKWNLKTIIYSLCASRFEKIIGVSNKILDEAIFKKIIKDKYITIYNYVDKEAILEKSSKNNISKKYDLFFVGRLSEAKNPLEYINVVKEYAKTKKDVRAVIIGDGELRDVCKDKIKELNINIDMLGFVENPFPIIKNSSVGIMPSKWEGFGLAAIETMILGKPVLNSGVGGLGEIFKNNKKYICKTTTEYVEKIGKLDKMPDGGFDDVIVKYCDLNSWKTKLSKIYKEKNK